jgi:hypothetical protein
MPTGAKLSCVNGTYAVRAAALMAVVLAVSSAVPRISAAQSQRILERFTATTTAMTPSGIVLRFDVLAWSDDEARAAAISRLTDEASEQSLAELPTLGYIWQSDSPVGYSIKYAHRAKSGDEDVLTFVTDKPLGSYGLKPWKAEGESTEAASMEYSVVVLRLDNDSKGRGTISLGADVDFDRNANTLSLADEAPPLLTGVRREPTPYWAQDSHRAGEASEAHSGGGA